LVGGASLGERGRGCDERKAICVKKRKQEGTWMMGEGKRV